MSLRDYKEELNIRSHRAGYTTRKGDPIPRKVMAAVGMGKTKIANVWPRNENGDLIGD